MDFIDEKLELYALNHTEIEPDLLKKINRETNLHILKPRMLSGHFQGRFLSMISKMINPKNILEIGTYTGYSALCLAEGLNSNGKLVTIDINEELEQRVRNYFNESIYSSNIKYLIGDANDILNTLDLNVFDLVFIDADKINYSNYYNKIIEHLKPNSYILIDNVLWSGKVLDEIKKNDLETKSIVEFNNLIQNDSRVENILLPIRDGLMLCRVV